MSRLPPAPNIAGVRPGSTNGLPGTQSAPPLRPLLAERSSSSSSSGSSHSSHSSHIEREREAHLGEAADQKPGVAKPVASAIAVILYIFAFQAIGLWLFTSGFLLTRTTLDDVCSCLTPVEATYGLPRPPPFESSLGNVQLREWEVQLLSHVECTLPPTYQRTILWIIDALRYDFIADAQVGSSTGNSSWQANEHYHSVFQTPLKLHKDSKTFSFLSHFLADAPTTTLQRLKGLTTGSLPTFIDAGSNFGGSAITEDNWLSQLQNKSLKDGKTGMGFVGDDTWITVFPSVFDRSWTWPFDSFNVEDLDSVDRGVESKLSEFLKPDSGSNMADWRLLVGHMLGVDHVGHRLGASHPRMKTKLEEMDTFTKELVENLPKDALLVLMGDHGMDERGDHGGDGELQVGSGLWMFSKSPQPGGGIAHSVIDDIVRASEELVPSHLPFSPLPSPPFAKGGHRSIPQIDFVPTISLLLGLPVPFNNLGSVIPEAFASLDLLLRALRINAIQIHRYLEKYSESSKDLHAFQIELDSAWKEALQKDAIYSRSTHLTSFKSTDKQAMMKAASSAYMRFNRLSLLRAREIWAQFEYTKMLAGLLVLCASLLTCFLLKSSATDYDEAATLLQKVYSTSKTGIALGACLTSVLKVVSLYVVPLPLSRSFSLVESALLGAAFGGQVPLLLSFGFSRGHKSTSSSVGLALPVLHALAFSSNSFTIHEDRLVLALTIATLAWRGVQGYLNGPTSRLRIRMPAFAVLAMVGLRLSSIVKVCREEQGPECKSTFYTGGEGALNGIWSIGIAYLCALVLPFLVAQALNVSRSFAGVAPLFVNWMLRPALLMAAGYWLMDWALTANSLGIRQDSTSYSALQWAKYGLARFDLALICIICLSFWVFSPLCLELTKEDVPTALPPHQRQQSQQQAAPQAAPAQRVIVLGFANSFGSSYALLLTVIFSLLFLIAQPSGQITLTATLITLFACAEMGDGERDTALIALRGGSYSAATKGLEGSSSTVPNSLPLSFAETSTLALIGFVSFFTTGHQATFDSIQWRTAFIGFETVNYPFSPLLVILNSFAPFALLPSMAVAFLVLYNLAPRPRAAPNSGQKTERMPVVMHILQASLSFALYHLIVTLSTAIFAAHFKRHLMLFKIWTPRFMLGAASLQLTFLGLILGLLATGNILSKVSVTFGSQF